MHRHPVPLAGPILIARSALSTQQPYVASACWTLVVLLSAGVAVAQPAREVVDIEPLTCWWRTDAGAVRVGEPFSVLLTCSVLEAAAARVIVDESRLDPGVVPLAPFEVLGGARAKDVVTAARRFIQFEYSLRIIGEVFGGDARLPPLQVTYRVESRADAGGSGSIEAVAVQGRDLTYVLPPLAIRVLSLVPDTARDIREAEVPPFQAIERARGRAMLLRVTGGVLFVLAVMLGAAALFQGVRRRQQVQDARQPAPAAAIAAAAKRELAVLLEASRAGGWTEERVGRALVALRVAAACATGRAVAQRRAADTSNGHLVVRTRSGPVLVSASVTAGALRDDPNAADLAAALQRFSAVRYGRDAGGDGLDAAIERVLDHLDRRAAGQTRLARTFASLERSVSAVRERRWAR